MEIVKKKLLLPYVTGTHLSTPQVPNTQNLRCSDLWKSENFNKIVFDGVEKNT
jgi:hypothetical protein